MERRKKNLARIRAQVEAGSIAMAEAHAAELERDREVRTRRANAPKG